MRTVYLDNNATTPVLPEVFEAMRTFSTELYGNPSSVHRLGSGGAKAMRDARRSMAKLLGCEDSEIIFTSCGTESDNLAIHGILDAVQGKHIVVAVVEHPAVMNPLRRLSKLGSELTILDVDADGMLDLETLRNSLRDDTALVTVMLANNETGTIYPLEEIASIAGARGIPLLVDAVQALGKIPIDLTTLRADALALSAHKFHGPKGVGLLFLRKGTPCNATILGGSQERGLRPGTENVAGIVAMAKACELAISHLDDYQTRVRAMRDRFEAALLERIPDSYVHGARAPRLPNTSSMCFRGIDGPSLLVMLDEVGICASAGSACKSGAGKPSHVLSAMGVSLDDAIGTMRFSLSTLTTEEDIDYALEHIPAVVTRMRG